MCIETMVIKRYKTVKTMSRANQTSLSSLQTMAQHDMKIVSTEQTTRTLSVTLTDKKSELIFITRRITLITSVHKGTSPITTC